MLKSEKINFLAKDIAPNPLEATFWIDLSEDPQGTVWKWFDPVTERWKVLLLGNQEGTLDAYTKAESDLKYASANSVGELANQLNSKQDQLVSKVNIKTINGQSILGEGNLVFDRGLNQNQVQDLIDESTKDFITVEETHEYVQEEIAKLKLVILDKDQLPKSVYDLIFNNVVNFDKIREDLTTTNNTLLYVDPTNGLYRLTYSKNDNQIQYTLTTVVDGNLVQKEDTITYKGLQEGPVYKRVIDNYIDNEHDGITITSTEKDKTNTITLYTRGTGEEYLADDGTYKILGSINLYTSMDRLPDCLAVLMDDKLVEIDRFIAAKQYLVDLKDNVYLLLTDVYNESADRRTIEGNQLYTFHYDEVSDSIYIIGSIDPLHQIYNSKNPQPRTTEVTQITNSAQIIRHKIADGIYGNDDGFTIELEDNKFDSVSNPNSTTISRSMHIITEGDGNDVLFNDGEYHNLQNSIDFSNYLAKDNTTPYTPTGDYNPATKKYVDTEIANLVDSAPETLDTLNELAAALNDNPNFATDIINLIATKTDKVDTGDVNNLKTEAKVVVDAINEHEDQINTHTAQITNIHSRLDEHDDRLDDIDDDVLVIKSTLNSHQQSLNTHTSKLQNHEQRLDGIDTSITNINKDIDDINAKIDSNTSDLEEALAAETQARQQADSTLQTNINNEVTARQQADKTLQSNIDAETTTRQQADQTLQTNIDTEESERKAADANLQKQIDDEEAARTAADTSINNSITSINQSITNINSKNNQQDTTISSIQTTVNNHTTQISTINSSITTIEGNISDMQENITNMQGDITDIQGDIQDIQSEINNLDPFPSGGSTGQVLKKTDTGMAWQNDNDTTYSPATTSAAGLMSAADKAKLDGIASGANAYTLPAATTSTLGGVKVGNGINVTTDGTISVDDNAYTLPVATETTLGGIKSVTKQQQSDYEEGVINKDDIEYRYGYKSSYAQSAYTKIATGAIPADDQADMVLPMLPTIYAGAGSGGFRSTSLFQFDTTNSPGTVVVNYATMLYVSLPDLVQIFNSRKFKTDSWIKIEVDKALYRTTTQESDYNTYIQIRAGNNYYNLSTFKYMNSVPNLSSNPGCVCLDAHLSTDDNSNAVDFINNNTITAVYIITPDIMIARPALTSFGEVAGTVHVSGDGSSSVFALRDRTNLTTEQFANIVEQNTDIIDFLSATTYSRDVNSIHYKIYDLVVDTNEEIDYYVEVESDGKAKVSIPEVANIPLATTTTDGLMSSTDKVTLDGLSALGISYNTYTSSFTVSGTSYIGTYDVCRLVIGSVILCVLTITYGPEFFVANDDGNFWFSLPSSGYAPLYNMSFPAQVGLGGSSNEDETILIYTSGQVRARSHKSNGSESVMPARSTTFVYPGKK